MNSKEYFFDEVIKEALLDGATSLRVLELGCGTAKYVPAMMAKYPQLEYVGIEPITASFEKALETLKDVPRAHVTSQLGYGKIEGLTDATFDIVISFSVLEHVKQLGAFMEMSARYVKPQGLMVHRYDLGHALHPTTLKEKLHVWIGNTLPALLPERTFVRYVPLTEVEGLYTTLLGVMPYRYTYHQMPNQKRLEEALTHIGYEGSLMEAVFAWEFAYAEDFARIPTRTREKLFPTVAVWGRKS